MVEHPADRAVRTRDGSALLAGERVGLDAVLTAFAEYEAGHDDAARAALQAIGLQSPFLDWKVLLRGLLAYSAGDDVRALENWQRLRPDRLPARLAAPLRAALDPALKTKSLERQYELLTPDPLLDGLRQLHADLSREKPLTGAFRRAEQLLPELRRHAPQLVLKLAHCFYRALLTHGEPSDLPRYRRVFGSPPDDPDFHRLEASIYDTTHNYAESQRHWVAYEKWLAGNALGWPADRVGRMRAIILNRMAENALDEAEDPQRELRELMSSFLGTARVRKHKPAAPPDPVPLWRKAAELAPDWDVPHRKLFDHLVEHKREAEAEAVARSYLEHDPTTPTILEALAALYAKNGRVVEARELRTRALAANPLDQRLRVLAAYAHHGAARRQLIDGELEAATVTLDAGRSVSEETVPVGYFALRSTLARKRGRAAEADEFRAKAEAVSGGRLAALFFLAVDAALAKLKPADKRAAEQAYAAALAEPLTPLEGNLLYAAWDQYHLEGITYRGQKTQEKKIHDALLRTAAADAPLPDLEVMARSAVFRHEWKLAEKLATALRERFPQNPVFPLILAECEFAKADGYPRPHRVARLLNAARKLAEPSTEPRHRELLDRIQELQRQAVDPDFWGDFFGE
jgi:hypothetical protein